MKQKYFLKIYLSDKNTYSDKGNGETCRHSLDSFLSFAPPGLSFSLFSPLCTQGPVTPVGHTEAMTLILLAELLKSLVSLR